MIERIPDHTARAQARIVEEYQDAVTVRGLVAAIVEPGQALEDATIDALSLRSIEDSEAAQLDTIGRVVGAEREGLDDPNYRLRLYAQILINRRSGEPETLIQILRLLLPASTSITYSEEQPATVIVEASGVLLDDASRYVRLLREAKAGGVRLLMRYQSAPDADLFTFEGGPGLGFGDSGNPAIGGKLAGIA